MPDYPYYWRVRTRLPERFGQRLRVLARGKNADIVYEWTPEVQE